MISHCVASLGHPSRGGSTQQHANVRVRASKETHTICRSRVVSSSAGDKGASAILVRVSTMDSREIEQSRYRRGACLGWRMHAEADLMAIADSNC